MTLILSHQTITGCLFYARCYIGGTVVKNTVWNQSIWIQTNLRLFRSMILDKSSYESLSFLCTKSVQWQYPSHWGVKRVK